MTELTCTHPNHQSQDHKRAYQSGWQRTLVAIHKETT